MRIVVIVEGHGEVHAVPLLIRRIVALQMPGLYVDIPKPIRIPKHKLLQERELERAVELAALQTGRHDGILILVDADRDCPAELGPQLRARAKTTRPDRNIHVVLAKCEYEAWFIAAAESIRGRRNLREDLIPPASPESILNAKGWLTERMVPGSSYREVLDQPALTELFDLNAARTCPSFDKLWRDVKALLSNHNISGAN